MKKAIGVFVLGGIAAAGGIYYWQNSEKDRTIAEQARVIGELGQKLDRAWAEEMVADVKVNGLGKDPATGKPAMNLTFVQYKPGTEEPEFQRAMTLPGDEFYIDTLVVKFDRPLIEGGDAMKGKSLLLFRRAFGDQQKPIDGVPLFPVAGDDTVVIPEKWMVDRAPGEFEKKIWSKFWELANDPDAAKAEGVRVAQGEAPHMKAMVGQVYKVTLRASGGVELVPRLPAALLKNPDSGGAVIPGPR